MGAYHMGGIVKVLPFPIRKSCHNSKIATKEWKQGNF
jgi:hypothetical protein